MSRTSRPPLERAPASATLPDGEVVDLAALAAVACRAYARAHPDEPPEYGDRWEPWCVHDMRYLLAWAVEAAVSDPAVLDEQVAWLHGVLTSRGYPAHRLRDALTIAAVVTTETLDGPWGDAVGDALLGAAGRVPPA